MRLTLSLLAALLLASPASAGDERGASPIGLWLTADVGPTLDFDYFLGTELGAGLNWFPLGDYLHLGVAYRYASGEVMDADDARLEQHTLAGLLGYGSYSDPVGYYTGVMLGQTRVDGFFAGEETDEWLFTIGFYGDMILFLGDVLGVTFHACSRYIQGELGFYGSYTFSFGLAVAL